MSRVCLAGGLLCELVQTGMSMSWQAESFHAGIMLGIVGLVPMIHQIGKLTFDQLTGGMPASVA